MKGRYGPYVTDGETNATVPDADNAEAITLEQALALIADRAAKGGGGKKKKKAAPKKKAAAPKKPTKSETDKKPAKKKATKPKAPAEVE